MINKFKITMDNLPYEIERKGEIITINGHEFPYKIEGSSVTLGGNPHSATVTGRTAVVDGISYQFEATGLDEPKQPKKQKASKDTAAEAGAITAIMPGLIIKVLKKEGDRVEKGDVVLILEAMKMQNELQAPRAGVIRQVKVKQGDSVEIRQVLAVLE